MCAYDLYGTEHILFGDDMSDGHEFGMMITREIIRVIEKVVIADPDKKYLKATPRGFCTYPDDNGSSEKSSL